MGQTNKTLQAAKDACDDEFYTPMWLAKDLIDPFIPQLKGKKIICPCDSPKSNIYIYLKELGMDVDYSTEMFAVKYRNYDVIITNPPFSKMRSFMRCIYGKKFIIIGFWLLVSLKFFMQSVQNFTFCFMGGIKYINNDKIVNTIFVTNLNEPVEWKNKMCNKLEDGKVYTADSLTKSNRIDFAEITLKENNGVSFFKLVYGKNNDWILNNIHNLNAIKFNNYEKNFNSVNAKDVIIDKEQMRLF